METRNKGGHTLAPPRQQHTAKPRPSCRDFAVCKALVAVMERPR